MIFSEEKAREFLMKNGAVYTLRVLPHKTRKDWINAGKGKPKSADVMIEEIGDGTNYCHLEDYVAQSGFDNVDEWWWTYVSLNEDEM